MKIGDKVRMLSGREEGFITKILPNNQIEIEISDGFRIPVLRNEVAIVSSEENRYFGKQTPIEEEELIQKVVPTKKKSVVGEGLYLAYLDFNDRLLNVYFINYTDYAMLVSVSEELENGKEKHLFAEVVSKEKAPRIHRLSREEFKMWKPLVIRAIFFQRNDKANYEFEPKPNLYYRMSYSNSFFRTKRTAPVLEKESYLFRIEGTEIRPDTPVEKMQTVDVDQLRERMLEGAAKHASFRVTPPAKEIDLHIEMLAPNDYDFMTNEAILTMQLEHFERILDQALAANMQHITFIHGVGNGVLRREIQRRLSQHTHVKFYQDAHKDRFGYGATTVTFK